MSNKLFTSSEIAQLRQNRYVKSVSDKGITYTDEFKEIFIRENQNGKLPRQIFEEHGFDIDVLGIQRIASAGKRWRSAFKKDGISGLQDRRKISSGHPIRRELTLEEELIRTKAELDLARAELELLKKLRQLRAAQR